MIVLRPDEVKFGNSVWSGVARVTVDRVSVETVDAWDDLGPNLVFVDVARQRVVVRVMQEIEGDEFGGATPGEQGLFSFVGSTGSDAGHRQVSCQAVVESVMNKVSDYGSSRVITLVAVSSDGSVDPVSVSG
ncbi:MAG: hypothetical protein ACWA5W_04020 [Phycisphaerales bacterium]